MDTHTHLPFTSLVGQLILIGLMPFALYHLMKICGKCLKKSNVGCICIHICVNIFICINICICIYLNICFNICLCICWEHFQIKVQSHGPRPFSNSLSRPISCSDPSQCPIFDGKQDGCEILKKKKSLFFLFIISPLPLP